MIKKESFHQFPVVKILNDREIDMKEAIKEKEVLKVIHQRIKINLVYLGPELMIIKDYQII